MRTVVVCVWLAWSAAAAEPPRRILVHGHRGSRGTHPENTLPAFAEALRAGADVLELDLAVTKDDVLVVSHDPRVSPELCLGPDGKRLAAAVPIRSLTLAQLKAYDCGSLKNPRFAEQVPVPGARIPTLDEVFLSAKSSPAEFNIETKIFPHEPALSPSPAEFAGLVARALRRHGLEGRTMVQSFDVRTLKEMKKLAPRVRTAQLTSDELVDILPALRSARADIWSPFFEWTTPEAVREVQTAGIQVAPWTLNEPKDWEWAAAAGVDAVITDYPAKLIGFLREKKLR
ncbi:MAG: glycerophosphodiester phosphodiesterase [Elusimicrobia bacterium]|nr:glycerophosphodiester phosphodiesterase [Elusimicrobiota bacterium]